MQYEFSWGSIRLYISTVYKVAVEHKLSQMNLKDYSGGLKFAVMVNSMKVQKWQAEVLDSLMKVDNVHPVLIVKNESHSSRPVSFLRKLLTYPWQNVLFKLFYRFAFKPQSFKPVSISSVLEDLPVINIAPHRKKSSEYFLEEDIEKIQSAGADFIIKFGFGILKGDILTSIPLGIWSFHHGDEQKYRGVPPGFWEIYENDPKTGAILQRLTEKLDGGVILRKGLFKTIDHSWNANLSQAISLSQKWPSDVCREIIAQGTFPDQTEGVTTTAPVYKVPGNTTFVLFLIKLFANKIKFHFNELFSCEIWQAGIIKARTADILSELQYEIDLDEVDWLKGKSNDYYIADGFAIKEKDRLLLMYEDYTYKTRKGYISGVWFNEKDYSFSQPTKLLEEKWHLSYPFIFRYKGDILVMPECKDHKKVELYRYDTSSMRLVLFRTLISDLEAVDPTLINHQNHWYLFFTSGHASNVELNIWHAENLEDNLVPHVLNPVKSNISNSRPAGSLFYLDGKLYRPSQDCSRSYGGRIILNEVKVLNEDYFLEMAVSVLEPPKGFQGLHNLSFAGDSMFFDVKRMGFSRANFINQFKRKTGFSN